MKAMKNVSRGKGFRGCLDYVFLRDEKARRAGKKPGILIGGNMSGHDPRTLAAEFGITRKVLTKRKIEKPVWHQTLRLPAGEKLPTEKWIEIADEYMSLMGFTGLHMRSYVLHDDEDGQHIHIVASRVGLDGDVYKGQNDNYRSTNIVRGLEKKHGLRVTSEEKRDKAQPSKNELEKALRTGKQPPKMVIQDTIDQIMACGSLTTSDFVFLLGEYEITAKANIASTGKLSGFSFSLASHTDKSGQPIFFKGSTLGKAFTAAGLESRGLQYNPILDMPILTGRHPQPAPDYSGDSKIRKKNGGREFSLIVFMRYEPFPGGQLYRWQSGAPAFIDLGNEIICAGKATSAKVRGMLDLASEKGWSRIELYGPREFQMAAAKEAARRGISLSGDNKEIQEIWRQEYDRAADARNGLGIDEQNSRNFGLRQEDVIDGIETRPSSTITTTPEASDTARNRASETGDPGTPARFDGDKKSHWESKHSSQDVSRAVPRRDFQNDQPWLAGNKKGNRGNLVDNGKKDFERNTGDAPRGLAALDQANRQPASPDSRSNAEERSLQQVEPKPHLKHHPSPGG